MVWSLIGVCCSIWCSSHCLPHRRMGWYDLLRVHERHLGVCLTLCTDCCGATTLRCVLSCRWRALLFVGGNSQDLELLCSWTSKHSRLLVDTVRVHSSVNVITILCEVGHVRLLADEDVTVGIDSRTWHTYFLNFVHRHVKGCRRILALRSLTCVLDSIQSLDMRILASLSLAILVKVDWCDTFVAIIVIASDGPSSGTSARELGNRYLSLSNDAISRLTSVKVYIEAIDTCGVHVGRSNTLLTDGNHGVAEVLIIDSSVLVVVWRIIVDHSVVYGSNIYTIILIYLILLFLHETVCDGLHARCITTIRHELLTWHPLVVLQSLLILSVVVCHIDFILRFGSTVWVNFRQELAHDLLTGLIERPCYCTILTCSCCHCILGSICAGFEARTSYLSRYWLRKNHWLFHVLSWILCVLWIEVLLGFWSLLLLLVLQSYLNSLAFLVQVYIRDVTSIKSQVLLPHGVWIQCLIHAISTILLNLLRHAAINATGPAGCWRFDSCVVIERAAIASWGRRRDWACCLEPCSSTHGCRACYHATCIRWLLVN